MIFASKFGMITIPKFRVALIFAQKRCAKIKPTIFTQEGCAKIKTREIRFFRTIYFYMYNMS